MPRGHGDFIWYDVMTTDTEAAEIFYRAVIGWDIRDAGMNDSAYSILSIGETAVGGLMAIPEEALAMGVPPCWSGDVAVDDVDAMAKRVAEAGGTVRRPPADIPNVGRYSVVADPQGAVFILFKGSSPQGPEPAPPGTPGTISWHELHAGDGPSAFAFYGDLFGWSKADAIDMGAMGTYQIFNTPGGQCGGVMTRMPQSPGPFWLDDIQVDAIDAALARVSEAGGQTVSGPMQVPGGHWIAQCLDPQGAIFAMVAMQR